MLCAGFSKNEVIGRNCRFMQGPDTDPAALAELRSAIEAQQPVIVELINYRKDGSKFWNQARLLRASLLRAALCAACRSPMRSGRTLITCAFHPSLLDSWAF